MGRPAYRVKTFRERKEHVQFERKKVRDDARLNVTEDFCEDPRDYEWYTEHTWYESDGYLSDWDSYVHNWTPSDKFEDDFREYDDYLGLP